MLVLGDFMLLNIKQVSKILGVSIPTLRNWDESGYLKAKRTEGKHRRYDEDDIKAFLSGKRSQENIITSWESDHLEKLRKVEEEDALKDERARECGGFSKADIALLINNQEVVAPINDLFFTLAEAFSAPYLFDTQVMLHPCTLTNYKRVRNKVVIECEEIMAITYISENFFVNEILFDVVENIDKICIQDVLNNVETIIETQNKEEGIVEAMRLIDEKTNTKEPKWVIYPPELCHDDNFKKLTNNLKVKDVDGYKVYISRLVPENKILVGTKSKDKFLGFVFLPYMIYCKDGYKYFMRVGRKLLREGDNYYAVVKV